MNFSESFEKSELMRPSVLLTIFTLIFIASSDYMPGLKGFLVIAFGIIAFFIGERIAIKKFNAQLNISKDTLFYFGTASLMISLGALYLIFTTAGGIPLFNPHLRPFIDPTLNQLAFLIVPGIVFIVSSFSKEGKYSRFLTFALIALGVFMTSLHGFRTEVIAAIIAPIVTAYYLGFFKPRDLFIFAIFSLIIFLGVTQIRTGGLGVQRATGTLSAYNFLIDNTPVFGLTNGYIEFPDFVRLFSVTPVYGGRNLISLIIKGREDASITTTLYGPPHADFGVLSAFVFVFFGLLLGAGYKAAISKKGIYVPTYAILLAFILIGIETGIADRTVWTYFGLIGFFYLLAHNYNSKT